MKPFRIHAFLCNKKVMEGFTRGIPRVGETVRLSETKYAKVTEVIWCLDENEDPWDRINLRLEEISE